MLDGYRQPLLRVKAGNDDAEAGNSLSSPHVPQVSFSYEKADEKKCIECAN